MSWRLHRGSGAPAVGIAPTLSDFELLTLAVMSALLGYTSERRWLRRPTAISGTCSSSLASPATTSGPRAAPALLTHMIRILATDTTLWSDVCGWSTPPRWAAAARETARRSDLAG